MRLPKAFVFVLLICNVNSASTQMGKQFPKNPGPVIPDGKTAIAIANIILRTREGDEYTEAYQPLRARKIDGRWFVDGLAYDKTNQLRTFQTVKIVFEPVTCRIAYYGIGPENYILEKLKGKKLDHY
jgi:hypothetical protein